MSTPISDLRREAAIVAENLLDQEPVRRSQTIFGEQLEELLAEVSGIYQDEARLQNTLGALYQQTQTYSQTYGAAAKKGKSKSQGGS